MKKQVLVTGASGGIGNAIAKALADDGYDVIATGLSQEELNDLAEHKLIFPR